MSVVIERRTGKVPPMTANTGMHEGQSRALRRATKTWRAWAADEARDRGLTPDTDDDPPTIPGPFGVEVIHLRRNYGSLPDVGAAYFMAKAMVDGLVDARVLAGDGPRFMRSLHFREPEIVGEHGVRVIVRELEQHHPTPLPEGLLP